MILRCQNFDYTLEKITEQKSPYNHLEAMSANELLENINKEDQSVALVLKNAIPQFVPLIEEIVAKMNEGGRLFYIGSGTSGRLGIVDASECPPTFGVPHGLVVGIIAGGDSAIRKAVEFAEDDTNQAWKDLQAHQISPKDVVVGISASGTTPYVLHGLSSCNQHQITTASITCNPDSPIEKEAQYPIVLVTGPEFVSGSTRMKAGTAQKLALNMISTAVMVRLGRVLDNQMVDMQLTNEKLNERAVKMIREKFPVTRVEAMEKLLTLGSVRKVLQYYEAKNSE